MNRVPTTRLAALHFAPTETSARNLREDLVPESRIVVTGNSGIDAVLYVRDRLEHGDLAGPGWPMLDPAKKLIAVTAHRRESFGAGFGRIAAALERLARRPDVQIVYPVHRNPNVQAPIRQALSGLANVFLIDPLDYVPFVDLMRRAHFLLTDSGGVQEEGPSLGKPVLVLRETTERPEAVEAGTVKLVGTDEDRIVAEATILLDDPAEHRRMSLIHNPYGDGTASRRIADAVAHYSSGAM
jgi:UDP-N-acetylglucosamine 2-epimerase (non-hydrolysing)